MKMVSLLMLLISLHGSLTFAEGHDGDECNLPQNASANPEFAQIAIQSIGSTLGATQSKSSFKATDIYCSSGTCSLRSWHGGETRQVPKIIAEKLEKILQSHLETNYLAYMFCNQYETGGHCTFSTYTCKHYGVKKNW